MSGLVERVVAARVRWEVELARPEQLPPEGGWSTWLYLAGRGAGKALDVDTPVPTPSGWSSMGGLRVGDELFSADGSVTRVVWHSGVQLGRECFRVVFSDGVEVVADGDHQWVVRSRADRRAGRRFRVVTTRGLLEGGLSVGVANPEANWQMPVNEALVLPDVVLPVHPWVLGFWLGDGSSKCAEVTVGEGDRDEVFGLLELCGEPANGKPRSRDGRTVTVGVGGCGVVGGSAERRAGSLHTRLRLLGVLGDKHIPGVYLRGSVGQRRALLAGLIDSDGYVVPEKGAVEITTVSERLAGDIAELVRSLGHRVSVGVGRASVGGKDCGPKYRVLFTVREGGGWLVRKRVLSRHHLGQPERLRSRYVRRVERVPSRPVCCIMVDHPSELYLAGREMLVTHNTRTAAEWVAWRCVREPRLRVAVVAPTFADARDTCVEGESGLLGVFERYGVLRSRNAWNRSIGELHLVNGSLVKLFSGDQPERLRGPQFHFAWVDELGAFRYEEAWEQLQFGLRLGSHPQTVVTTTPRGKRLLRDLVGRRDGSVVVSRGSTFDNRANLAPSALAELLARYDGTRLGRQELYGELLEDVEGALWSGQVLDDYRVRTAPGGLVRVVVGVDPAVSDTGDETGIVVAGRDRDGHGFVLEDVSLRGTPDQWASAVIRAYDRWEADAVVVEVNQGGQMVSSTLRTVRPSLPIREVRASKGKRVRAEPISALYEQGRVHHVGMFTQLEEQLLTWTPDGAGSPDRMDALVWALTDLLQHSNAQSFLSVLAKFCPSCGYPNRQSDVVCGSCRTVLAADTVTV